MSWSWSFVPARLLNDGAFIRLSKADRALLYGCYHACDKWGCGPLEPVALGRAIGDFDYDGLAASMTVLRDRGFVAVSSCGTAWRLHRYEDDAPAELIRRRGRPTSFARLFINDSERQAMPGSDRMTPDDSQPSRDDMPRDVPDRSPSTRDERQAKRRGATEGGRPKTPKKDSQGEPQADAGDKIANDYRRQAESGKVQPASGSVRQDPDTDTTTPDVVRHRLEQTETETVPLTGNRLSQDHEASTSAPASPPAPLRGASGSGAHAGPRPETEAPSPDPDHPDRRRATPEELARVKAEYLAKNPNSVLFRPKPSPVPSPSLTVIDGGLSRDHEADASPSRDEEQAHAPLPPEDDAAELARLVAKQAELRQIAAEAIALGVVS